MSKYSGLFDAKTQPAQVTPGQQPEPPGRRGRPPGKRNHPDYEQITAYIRRNTHHQVKLALLREAKGRQFSDLVEAQLSAWLQSHR